MDMVKSQNISDPTITQLIDYAQKGDSNSIMNYASSLFAQKGLDLQSELNSFMELMK